MAQETNVAILQRRMAFDETNKIVAVAGMHCSFSRERDNAGVFGILVKKLGVLCWAF